MRNINDDVRKKLIRGNTLKRFAGLCPGVATSQELGFVNHIPLVFRISFFVQAFFKGRRCGVPT
jgi:hypothetical protein